MLHEDGRETARRQHRIIALLAAIQCWMNKSEGVILQRGQLERLLGVKRIRTTRINWIKYDMSDLFPHIAQIRNKADKVMALMLSRKEYPSWKDAISLKEVKTMTLWERVKVLDGDSHSVVGLLQNEPEWSDERMLATVMTLISQGHISPKTISDFTSAAKAGRI